MRCGSCAAAALSTIARELRGELDQRQLVGVEQGEVGRVRQLDPRLRRLAVERADPGMGILDVEDRIVLRRLDHLGEVEIHLRVGLAGQHGEADHVLADFVARRRRG